MCIDLVSGEFVEIYQFDLVSVVQETDKLVRTFIVIHLTAHTFPLVCSYFFTCFEIPKLESAIQVAGHEIVCDDASKEDGGIECTDQHRAILLLQISVIDAFSCSDKPFFGLWVECQTVDTVLEIDFSEVRHGDIFQNRFVRPEINIAVC